MSNKTSLFVVGDSISIGYGPFLKSMTQEHFDYSRKSGEEAALKNLDIPAGANGGNSAKVLAYLEALAASESFSTDILLLNCGLHDLNQNRETGEYQVPLEQYRENLVKVAEVAKQLSTRPVWVSTTPV
ncbi:MAG: SGNH/GDSL hydrolase family protein, partial [Planctomycetota bacterium]